MENVNWFLSVLLLAMSSGRTYRYLFGNFHPSVFPADATKVYIFHASIPIIPSGNIFSHLSRLNELGFYDTLFHNTERTIIEPGAFEGLTALNTLYFRITNISSLAANTFTGLSSLRTLEFENSQISHIEIGAFQSLISLETLWLNFNNLTFIEVGVFNGLTSLETLDLSFNE